MLDSLVFSTSTDHFFSSAYLTVVVLDRPRHQNLVNTIRELGVRICLISDGDISAALMTAWPNSGIDVLLGAGGSKEAVVAACALKCLGGEMQCIPWIRHEDETAAILEAGFDPASSWTMETLAPGKEISAAVTGITGVGMLSGVVYHNWWAETHSLVMRAKSGTVREIRAKHHVALRPEDSSKVR